MSLNRPDDFRYSHSPQEGRIIMKLCIRVTQIRSGRQALVSSWIKNIPA